MKTNQIITIGRQFGSGGKIIGETLAKELEIPFYDKKILSIAAKESGMCEELFEDFDEKPTNSFLYSLVMDPYSLGYGNTNSFNGLDMPINQKIFLAAFDAIKKIANEGPCVIVGRCADYALDMYENCINLFIHAPIDIRIKRIIETESINEQKAKELIQKKDKQRASYYNYYTTKKWGDIKSYDLCIDSSILGVDGTVALIKQFISMKENLK